MTFARGLLRSNGKSTRPTRSRKRPALLAALAGLGAAGAAAMKLRRSGDQQSSGDALPSEPVGETTSAPEATRPPGA